jgi:hypothetical protein
MKTSDTSKKKRVILDESEHFKRDDQAWVARAMAKRDVRPAAARAPHHVSAARQHLVPA